MGTYASAEIGKRICEIMEQAGLTINGFALQISEHSGMNRSYARDLICELMSRPYLNDRKAQAQVRANQISLIYEELGVLRNDLAVMLMREECAKLGLQFEYPLLDRTALISRRSIHAKRGKCERVQLGRGRISEGIPLEYE